MSIQNRNGENNMVNPTKKYPRNDPNDAEIVY